MGGFCIVLGEQSTVGGEGGLSDPEAGDSDTSEAADTAALRADEALLEEHFVL